MGNPQVQHDSGFSRAPPVSPPPPSLCGQPFDSRVVVRLNIKTSSSPVRQLVVLPVHQWAGASLTGYRYPQMSHPWLAHTIWQQERPFAHCCHLGGPSPPVLYYGGAWFHHSAKLNPSLSQICFSSSFRFAPSTFHFLHQSQLGPFIDYMKFLAQSNIANINGRNFFLHFLMIFFI